jgi:WhiB family transcriptional regulator, redox-sensing transcriptional regulator
MTRTSNGVAVDMPDWRRSAACLGRDTNLWYPEGAQRRNAREAKAVCQGCPVRAECLDFAIKHGERGVWGGLNEYERAKLTRLVSA